MASKLYYTSSKHSIWQTTRFMRSSFQPQLPSQHRLLHGSGPQAPCEPSGSSVFFVDLRRAEGLAAVGSAVPVSSVAPRVPSPRPFAADGFADRRPCVPPPSSTLNLSEITASSAAASWSGSGAPDPRALRADDSPTVPPPSKNSVWALYMRAMLMWNSCISRRTDAQLSDADKAQFALDAWTEIDAIEKALGGHNCGIERAFLFQGRELLFK